MAELTIIEAIRAAILNEMEEDERVMVLGLDVGGSAAYSGPPTA